MKVTIFTSNSLRHKNLINSISRICNNCYAIIESKTLFPGKVDDFFKKSKLHHKYFNEVEKSEKFFFKNNNFIEKNVKTTVIKQGDLNLLKKNDLKAALKSDLYIVFGSSYIKGWLIKFLMKKKAINIHMGLSPFYRGSSCNFWAMYDENPNYVGATIHYLSEGLDSGKIISHCLPNYKEKNFFRYTMSSVKSAHNCLRYLIYSKKLFKLKLKKQNKIYQIRYSNKNEFNEKILKKFFKISKAITKKEKIGVDYHLKDQLVNPFYYNKKEV